MTTAPLIPRAELEAIAQELLRRIGDKGDTLTRVEVLSMVIVEAPGL